MNTTIAPQPIGNLGLQYPTGTVNFAPGTDAAVQMVAPVPLADPAIASAAPLAAPPVVSTPAVVTAVIPEQAPPTVMATAAPVATSAAVYTTTTTTTPQVNLPAAPVPAVTSTSCDVVDAENIELDRIRYFQPTEHSTKDATGKNIKYHTISAKYMHNADVSEFYVNFCEMVAPDGIRKNVYEKKTGDDKVVLDPKTGKPVTSTEHSIRITFSKSDDKHLACLQGLNIASKALVTALHTHRFRVGLGDFDPTRSDSTLKPLVQVPVDKTTGEPLDLPPSMYLKVHKGKRTPVYWGHPGPNAILMKDNESDILIGRLIKFIPTVHIKGLYIGSKASIQSAAVSLFITDIGDKIDPSIYQKISLSVTEASVTHLGEKINKLVLELNERKRQEQEQERAQRAETVTAAPVVQTMAPIPDGGNGFSGLPGGQVPYNHPATQGAQAVYSGYGQPQGYGNTHMTSGYEQQTMQSFTAAAPQRFS